MKRLLVAGLIGLVLGGLATYLTLRLATQAFEDRALAAESQAAVYLQLADQRLETADSARDFADSIRAESRPLEIRTRVERVLATVPDTAQIDSLVAIIGDLETALADSTTIILAKEREVLELRESLRLATAAVDTVTIALGSRPSAMVTWGWKPKLNLAVYAGLDSVEGTCTGVGPRLALWRIQAAVYGAICAHQVTDNLPQSLFSPRAGVRISLMVL